MSFVRSMRLPVVLVLLAVFFAMPAKAQNPQEAFVANLGQKVITILGHKDQISQQQIKQEFTSLLRQNFDIPGIGRFVLGQYWRAATPEQQKEYLSLFQGMIVNVYTQRFNDYAGQTLQVTGSQADGDAVIVKTQIAQPDGSPPVIVDWRVRGSGASAKITDVIVENVSMSITQRADFASVIEQNGGNVEGLLAVLRQKAAQ